MLTIVADSHTHGMPAAVLKHIEEVFKSKTGFFIETVSLPDGITVPCDLHGPAMGDAPVSQDEVVMERRGERPYDSRLIDRPARQIGSVVVIAGPHEGQPCVLYTCYGGKLAAPREPGDPTLSPADRVIAEAFWATHALSR